MLPPTLVFSAGPSHTHPFIPAALWDWACPNALNRWVSHKGPCFLASWCPTWLITPKYQTQHWYSGSWSCCAMGLQGRQLYKKLKVICVVGKYSLILLQRREMRGLGGAGKHIYIQFAKNTTVCIDIKIKTNMNKCSYFLCKRIVNGLISSWKYLRHTKKENWQKNGKNVKTTIYFLGRIKVLQTIRQCW